MRRAFFTFAYIFCICLAALLLAAPPLIVSTAKKSIAAVLPDAAVGIKACSLWPPGTCSLSGIEIQRAGVYRVSIPSVIARVFTGTLPEIAVKGIIISLREPNARIAGISRLIRLQSSGTQRFPVGNIRISDLEVDVQTADARMQATGSVLLNVRAGELREVSLRIPALQFSGVNVTNAVFDGAVQKPGSCVIEKLSAGKAVARDIRSTVVLDKNKIRIEDLAARIFGGSIKGSASITIAAGVPYKAEIHAVDLDMSVFISDFNLGERIELSGTLGGAAAVQGSAAGCTRLSGDLQAGPPGGVLNIRDQATIDMIAQRSGQARDLISRSFTDYRYDVAQARVYAQKNKLILDVSFDGLNGKRKIAAVLHDFAIQGGKK